MGCSAWEKKKLGRSGQSMENFNRSKPGGVIKQLKDELTIRKWRWLVKRDANGFCCSWSL